MQPKIVILGTGGTIAGTAASATDAVGYTAAQLGVVQLVAAVPALAQVPLECEQVAQLDSKDMDHATWQCLAQRCAHHLVRAEVAGVVVTHGTDTLEETAYFLHRVLAPAKPLVLTAAMRPATALQADGPQNLLDAVRVAQHSGARGVLAVLAGTLHGAPDVFKLHSYRLDAFSSGDAGPIGYIEEGRLRCVRAWLEGQALSLAAIAAPTESWPRVEIVTAHAGADGAIVDALVAQGARGLVLAGCGNGNLHLRLEAAVARAREQGVRVVTTSRCAQGVVVLAPNAVHNTPSLSPVKARIELMLALLSGTRE
jgi:L-asparaginase